MQLKLTKTTVRIGAVGALAAAAALGFTQAALAAPAQGAVSVPCSAAALASAISGAIPTFHNEFWLNGPRAIPKRGCTAKGAYAAGFG